MSVDKPYFDKDVQFMDRQRIPICLARKPYIAPKLIQIHEMDISNNLGSGADGDAATAHS